MIISASNPGISRPISFSLPCAYAPFTVASFSAEYAGTAVGSRLVPFASSAASFNSSNKSCELFEAQPSVPRETLIPLLSIAVTFAIPLASLRFDTGLCATETPRRARILISRFVK